MTKMQSSIEYIECTKNPTIAHDIFSHISRQKQLGLGVAFNSWDIHPKQIF